jgi:hypothetical protein
LESGDTLMLGGQAVGYQLLPLPRPNPRRTWSALEWGTLGILVLLVVGQGVLLLGPALRWRGQVDVALLRPTPTPVPTPVADATAETGLEAPVPEDIPMPAATSTPVPAPTPTQTPTPPPRPTATPVPATEGKSPEELTALALKQIEAGNDLAADRILEQLERTHPDYVPGRVERARLYRKRSLFQEGMQAWKDVLSRVEAGSPMAREAEREIRLLQRRLDFLDKPAPTPEPFPTLRPPGPLPTPVPAPRPVGPAEVVNLKVTRYAQSSAYDMLRMATFQLRHREGSPAVLAGTAAVRVTFYDIHNGRVEPAKIPNPVVGFRIKGGMSGGKTYQELSAAYEVPKGQADPDRRYFGTVVELLIEDEVVERVSDTPELLQQVEEGL